VVLYDIGCVRIYKMVKHYAERVAVNATEGIERATVE